MVPLAAVLLLAAEAHAATVMIGDPMTRGTPDRSVERLIVEGLKKRFACVKPATMELVRDLLEFKKDRFDLTGEMQELDDIDELIDTDLVLMSRYTKGEAGRLSIGVTLMWSKRNAVVAQAVIDVGPQGTTKAVDELATRIADQFQLCELVGTVTVERTTTRKKKDVETEQVPSEEGRVGTRTVTHEENESSSEKWNFEVRGTRKLHAKVSVTGNGTGGETNRSDSKGLLCRTPDDIAHHFATFGNAEVGTFSWTIDKGLEMPEAVRIDFNEGTGKYTLSLNAGATGTVRSKQVLRRTGECGSSEEVLSEGEKPHAVALLWSSPELNGRRSEEVHSHTHYETSDDKTVRTMVRWDLRWTKKPLPPLPRRKLPDPVISGEASEADWLPAADAPETK